MKRSHVLALGLLTLVIAAHATPAFAYWFNGNPGLLPNASPVCVDCHGNDWSTGAKGPHGAFTNATDLCDVCHNVHVAKGTDLLFQADAMQTCRGCHDGTGGYSVYNITSLGGTPVSGHRMAGTATIPGGSPTGGSSTGTFVGPDGKLSCDDCHSPHNSNTVEPFTHWRYRYTSMALYTSNDLLRKNPGSSPATTTAYGSDWCLACHRGRGSSGMVNNHPVDSSATAPVPYTYQNVPLGSPSYPAPLALSADETQVYVADIGNRRIEQFSTGGAFVRQWPIDGTGQVVGLVLAGDRNGDASRDLMGLVRNWDVYMKALQEWRTDGTMIREDMYDFGWEATALGSNRSGGSVTGLEWTASGTLVRALGATPLTITGAAVPKDGGGAALGVSWGAAVSAGGTLYVADCTNSRVAAVNISGAPASWAITGYFPGGPLPVAGSAPGQLQNPRGIAVGPTGDLYVVDSGNDRIQVFTPAGAVVRVFGDGVLKSPGSIVVAADGTSYVSDCGNQRIVVFAANGSLVRTFGSAGTGAGQFALDNRHFGPVSSAGNEAHLMADPRSSAQVGRGPICQQCHENQRDPGTLVNGVPVVSGNARASGFFPHESANPNMLVETYDGLCLNCHSTKALP